MDGTRRPRRQNALHKHPVWVLIHKVSTQRLHRGLFGTHIVEVVVRLVLEQLYQNFHTVVHTRWDLGG